MAPIEGSSTCSLKGNLSHWPAWQTKTGVAARAESARWKWRWFNCSGQEDHLDKTKAQVTVMSLHQVCMHRPDHKRTGIKGSRAPPLPLQLPRTAAAPIQPPNAQPAERSRRHGCDGLSVGLFFFFVYLVEHHQPSTMTITLRRPHD